MKKEERIAIRVSVEDFKKINQNAKSFGLATGTYLRLLGLSGGNPFPRQERAADTLDPRTVTHVEAGLSPQAKEAQARRSLQEKDNVHKKTRHAS